ncbi:hypothetical protein NDU88_005994 [Pleurodeles waltl]|uniref:Secreted protein n=1 Tax=Pleurodeles waltl TaxID=8319 RepID=A0AAV7WYN8_PLEWA|nr:hypothetical protein NDU88_005994 [Pleurodeles waltl]
MGAFPVLAAWWRAAAGVSSVGLRCRAWPAGRGQSRWTEGTRVETLGPKVSAVRWALAVGLRTAEGLVWGWTGLWGLELGPPPGVAADREFTYSGGSPCGTA